MNATAGLVFQGVSHPPSLSLLRDYEVTIVLDIYSNLTNLIELVPASLFAANETANHSQHVPWLPAPAN
jgi:hypothetical protein